MSSGGGSDEMIKILNCGTWERGLLGLSRDCNTVTQVESIEKEAPEAGG